MIPTPTAAEALHEYGIEVESELPQRVFDTVVLAVRHDEIIALGEKGVRASRRS